METVLVIFFAVDIVNNAINAIVNFYNNCIVLGILNLVVIAIASYGMALATKLMDKEK